MELRIDWDSAVARHRDRYVESVGNLANSGLPSQFVDALTQSADGKVEHRFGSGELVAPYDPGLIVSVPASTLHIPPRYPAPLVGRAFPKSTFAQTLSGFVTEHPHVRTLSWSDTELTVDLNHPLSRVPLELRATNLSQDSPRSPPARNTTQGTVVRRFLDTGPGLQAPHSDAHANFFETYPLSRDDEESDGLFYDSPRLVQHIDACAIGQINALYARLLEPSMKVLDLLSSWKSHLPEDWAPMDGVCVGMNEEELSRNEQLRNYLVHDLNRTPGLPFANESFDAVICNVSVEYLVRPLDVFEEAFRVLRSGGVFINTFSDRCFPTKAVRLWRYLHPFERLQYALALYQHGGKFERLRTETVRGLPRPADDDYTSQNPFADPLYAVYGYRQ